MKKLMIGALALLVWACAKKELENTKLFVGASARSITPEAGAFIAGDRLNRNFTGVHDSLFVKALVWADGRNSMALLTFDCIGMLYPTLQQIREVVAEKIPMNELDPVHIMMASSHTHSGPDVVGIWGPDQLTSGVDSLYMKKLVATSAETLLAAWHSKRPAKVAYAEARFGEDWVYNISDSLNLDRALTVLQFMDTEGKSMATLTNFACHPTIMDGSNSLVSADYLSGFYTDLDRQLGGVNCFVQGPIGGWVQPEYEPKTFESAAKRGSELGIAVTKALEKSIVMDSAPLHFQSKQIMLPVSNAGFQQLSMAGVIHRPITDSVATEVAWFSIGNAQLATHPGETTPTYGLATKKLMPDTGPKFVIGLGMDALGYILTPDFYVAEPVVKHSEYLRGMSIDPMAGPLIMKAITELANNKE
jgi:hypothetical protein